MDTITAFKRLRKLRVMTEMLDIHRAYKFTKITNISRTGSQQKISNKFTRTSDNNKLQEEMSTNCLNSTTEQCISKWDYGFSNQHTAVKEESECGCRHKFGVYCNLKQKMRSLRSRSYCVRSTSNKANALSSVSKNGIT